MSTSNETKPKTKRESSSSDSEKEPVKIKTGSSGKSKKEVSTEGKSKHAKSGSTKEDAPSEKEVGKYKELWEKGIAKGLISSERQPEYRFSRMVNKKELISQLADYKKADSKEKKKMTKAFESNLDDKISKADIKKSTNKKSKSHKKHHDKDKSHKKHHDKDKSYHKGGTHKKGGKSTEDKTSGTPLMQLWSKATEKGLIEEANQWHRELTEFITYSELKVLYTQYKESKKKDELKANFNEKITTFNSSTPEVYRYFKVFRSYSDVWKAAITAKLIAEETKLDPVYAAWLPAKTLVAYITTVLSLPVSADRKIFRETIGPLIAAKIEKAIESIANGEKLKQMSNADLFIELKNGFSSDQISLGSKKVDKLSSEDMVTAYMSWQKHTPESEHAKSRQATWNSYLKYLSED